MRRRYLRYMMNRNRQLRGRVQDILMNRHRLVFYCFFYGLVVGLSDLHSFLLVSEFLANSNWLSLVYRLLWFYELCWFSLVVYWFPTVFLVLYWF